MFPLGLVLLPHMELPLRVFEPRYVALLEHCARHEPEFGVVLIERGRDVGGGDTRFDVGCVARIDDVQPRPDGLLGVVARGTRRLRVDRWLPDDPFPRAEIEEWPDPPPGASAGELLDRAAATLRGVLALAVECGFRVPLGEVDVDPDDPVAASYQLVTQAPLAAIDKLALLGSVTVEARATLLDERLRQVRETLSARLTEG